MVRILFLVLLGVFMVAADPPPRTLVLGGGCFWCLDGAYRLVPGVLDVECGYAGGHVEHPDYQQVCDGTTGHAEVVRITFNPALVNEERLLTLFWKIHDPTTLNRQGHDVGSQYRSIILPADDAQEAYARAAIAAETSHWSDPLVTEIQRLDPHGAARFHRAEDYHQDYFRRNPTQGYCRAVVRHKVERMREALHTPTTIRVRELGPDGRLLPAAEQAPLQRSEAEWQTLLAPEVFRILRHAGTEPPFCGGLLHEHGRGWFCCAGCGLPLFASEDKFDSGTGWPSFLREAAPENVRRLTDRSHGMIRTEIRCARCDGHLGHVFDDGPAPTHTRHCLNAAALVFRSAP